MIWLFLIIVGIFEFKMGLPQLRLHDLRHSMASNIVNSGRTIYEVAKVLGNAQIKTSIKLLRIQKVSKACNVRLYATQIAPAIIVSR